jgi:hypothetical protein
LSIFDDFVNFMYQNNSSMLSYVSFTCRLGNQKDFLIVGRSPLGIPNEYEMFKMKYI